MINEICGNETTTSQLNTGGKKQCLEGAVRTYILAKDTFVFADLAAAKSQAAWDAAKTAKDIVVFYDVEELAPNNTEAVIKNGRYSDYKITPSVKGVNYTHYLSTCSHEAVKSYEDSEYNKIFRITDKNELLCEVNDDGTVSGEPLTSMIVGERDDAPVDGTPSTIVQFKFDSYSLSIIIPDIDLTALEGIYDVTLTQVSASSSSIRFKVNTSCSGDAVTSLTDPDIVLNDVAGVAFTHSFVAPDAEGVYELTGTGFLSDFTVEVNGVVAQPLRTYEGEAPLTITVT